MRLWQQQHVNSENRKHSHTIIMARTNSPAVARLRQQQHNNVSLERARDAILQPHAHKCAHMHSHAPLLDGNVLGLVAPTLAGVTVIVVTTRLMKASKAARGMRLDMTNTGLSGKPCDVPVSSTTHQ